MRNAKTTQAAEPFPGPAEEPKALAVGRGHRPAEPPADRNLLAARRTVQKFLAAEFHAREIRVTKVARAPEGADTWHVEAEMLVPDLAIKTLGLPLTQQVLEKELCAVELNPDMSIKSYELVDARER